MTHQIHTTLYPGPAWCIFHILTSKDIDDVISRFFTAVCVWVVVCLYNKNPGRWVHPYMKYMGMCCPKGYGFLAVLV